MSSMDHPFRGLIGRLQEQIEAALGDQLTPGRRVALLDFPDHGNVGDSAIYQGEVQYLRKKGVDVAYVSKLSNLDVKRCVAAIGEDGVVLLHGGGNFGDIWKEFQRFRLHAIRSFPNHRIVQLPQSLHFSAKEGIRETAEVIRAHGNVLVLTRDSFSHDLVRDEIGCEVRLSPDMAFAIGTIATTFGDQPISVQSRQDQEQNAALGEQPRSSARPLVFDWPDEPRLQRVMLRWRSLAQAGLAGHFGNKNRVDGYDRLSALRVQRGVSLLSRSQTFVTDRLHGHILALLLGQPHVVLDNSYGKISRFASTWGTLTPSSRAATSFAEACEMLTGQPVA